MGVPVSLVGRGSVLIALALVATARSAAAQAPGASGSQVPCAVPLEWRIDDIDSRFDLSAGEALRAAREAGSMWERAVGRELFRFGGDGAHPISFEYDDRQATVERRRQVRRELDTAREHTEARRAGIEEASRELETARDALERDVEAHDEAMTVYNEDVARWNERGGAPEEVRSELERRLAELNRRREVLRSRESDLRVRSREIQREVDDLNDGIRELQAREERFARDFTTSAAESGRYDETVRRQDGRLLPVERRIRVFTFEDRAHLVVVLAHELGHALGLGHAPGPGSVMSAVFRTGDGRTVPIAVTGVDLAMLRSRCEDLAGGSPEGVTRRHAPHGPPSPRSTAPRRVSPPSSSR